MDLIFEEYCKFERESRQKCREIANNKKLTIDEKNKQIHDIILEITKHEFNKDREPRMIIDDPRPKTSNIRVYRQSYSYLSYFRQDKYFSATDEQKEKGLCSFSIEFKHCLNTESERFKNKTKEQQNQAIANFVAWRMNPMSRMSYSD